MSAPYGLLIVGGGPAGLAAARAYRKLEHARPVAIVSDEHSLARVKAVAIEDRAMTILRTCIAAPAQHALSSTDGLSNLRSNGI